MCQKTFTGVTKYKDQFMENGIILYLLYFYKDGKHCPSWQVGESG